MKALQCPFLSRLPVSMVSKNAPALLNMAADKCPIMQHAVQYGKMAASKGEDFQGLCSLLKLVFSIFRSIGSHKCVVVL